MILRAPALLYPSQVFGLFPKGFSFGGGGVTPPVISPGVLFSVGGLPRSVRWFDAGYNGVETFETKTNYRFWDSDGRLGRIEFKCNSFESVRKPSGFSFGFEIGGIGTVGDPFRVGSSFFGKSDCLVSEFGNARRSLYPWEMAAVTIENYPVMAFYAGLGSFFTVAVYFSGVVGGYSVFKVVLNSERSCRLSCSSLNTSLGAPAVSFVGDSSYAVKIRAASGADVVASEGGYLFNPGFNDSIDLLIGGDGSTAYDYFFTGSVEMPYDL